jgi:hypothetical protein
MDGIISEAKTVPGRMRALSKARTSLWPDATVSARASNKGGSKCRHSSGRLR